METGNGSGEVNSADESVKEIPLEENTQTPAFDENGVGPQPQMSADERLNRMVLKELEESGGKTSWTVFFQTGQVSTFIIKDREKLEAKLNAGGNCIELPELNDVKGFTNGKIFVMKDQLVFSILRDKSSIIQPERKLVLVNR